MNPEQALTLLVQAARQAHMNASDHQAVEAAKDALVNALGIGQEAPEPDAN